MVKLTRLFWGRKVVSGFKTNDTDGGGAKQSLTIRDNLYYKFRKLLLCSRVC